ncbi:MAG: alpha-amylase family glycosyl hydrolase, partial [Mycobacterium sp.]
MTSAVRSWWQTAVVYQVYIRSFADGNGDGIGDIAGMRARLPYLARLGVDAIWINPWYPSPMADAGYDVADYRDIEPAYGTLDEAQTLIAEAHGLGIRVLLDIVPNHTSDEHAWFRAALADEPGARQRYHFRPGRGADGALPPNNWQSVFGGPAWTRVADGDWYLHLFAPGQPDLDWEHDEVRSEFEDILAFWFDRGVDGFRIDVAHGLVKQAGLPDVGDATHTSGQHPAWDQDGVHDVYRGWRAVAERYSPDRVFIAEAWVSSNERLARYLRPDELHTAFQFDFLRAPWRATALRAVIDDAVGAAASVGAPPTWVLSNHDVTRTVTRFARSQPKDLIETGWERGRWTLEDPDHELGRRRARAAALVQLALPG